MAVVVFWVLVFNDETNPSCSEFMGLAFVPVMTFSSNNPPKLGLGWLSNDRSVGLCGILDKSPLLLGLIPSTS